MFSVAEMQLIREKPDCLSKFEELLSKLSISVPDWNVGDEFKIYEETDKELTRKVCELMKSKTVIEGYTNLLKLGGISYDYSESLKQLLEMVVTNSDKIFAAACEKNNNHDSWEKNYGNISPEPEEEVQYLFEISKSRHFDKQGLIDKFEKIADKYRMSNFVPKAVEKCMSAVAELKNIWQVARSKATVNSFEKLQEIILKNLDSTDMETSETFQVTVHRKIIRHEKELPKEPPKPLFNVEEVTETLEVLGHLREIILLEG